MECPKHTSERVFMVCKSCVKYPLVCGVCIEEGEHAGHKLQTLRNAAQSIREDLEQVEKDKCQVFDEIKSDLKGLAKIREDQKMEASRVGDEIIKRADVVKGEVDTVNKEVVEKHKTELDKNTAAIDNTEIALTQQVSRIEIFQKKVAQLQKTNDYVEVIMVARDVEIPDTSRIPKPDIQNLKFLPGIANGTELEKMFGTITGEGDDNIATVNTCEEEDDKSNISSDFVGSIQRESNIEVTRIKSFKLSQKDGIRYMFSPEPDVCLLKCNEKNSIKHSNGSGQIKHSINLGTKTNGFTVTTDNQLLFCCTHQECIKEMELPSGEIIERIDTSPLIPNCICTGPSGDIYVTLYDEVDYDVTEDSIRVLDRYNRWGRKKKRCKNDRCGRNIFVLPDEICVNNTGTRVAVINKINERLSELILLDRGLRPVLIYRGPSVITGNVMGGFELTGVMFDSTDNILTTEVFSKTVQLLSPSCEPLKTLLIMDTNPWSIAIHGNEVWVGDNGGGVKTFRYSY